MVVHYRQADPDFDHHQLAEGSLRTFAFEKEENDGWLPIQKSEP